MTIREAAESLRSGQVSSVELTTAAIARIDRLDANLRAFITVTPEQAMAHAKRADSELAAGTDRGPLHGIPIALKDLFATRGVRTTGGTFLRPGSAVPAPPAAGGGRRSLTPLLALAAAGLILLDLAAEVLLTRGRTRIK